MPGDEDPNDDDDDDDDDDEKKKKKDVVKVNPDEPKVDKDTVQEVKNGTTMRKVMEIIRKSK